MPCKHFCAIFQIVPGWSWKRLPVTYRKNPLFLLDTDFEREDQNIQEGEGGFVSWPRDHADTEDMDNVLHNSGCMAESSDEGGYSKIFQQGEGVEDMVFVRNV